MRIFDNIRDARKQLLEKQISAFQAKVRKEKQMNKQVQLNAELKALKKDWSTFRGVWA